MILTNNNVKSPPSQLLLTVSQQSRITQAITYFWEVKLVSRSICHRTRHRAVRFEADGPLLLLYNNTRYWTTSCLYPAVTLDFHLVFSISAFY